MARCGLSTEFRYFHTQTSSTLNNYNTSSTLNHDTTVVYIRGTPTPNNYVILAICYLAQACIRLLHFMVTQHLSYQSYDMS